MVNIPVVLSILFYFSFVISAFLGAYSLYKDFKAHLNRVFFIHCLAMGIFALSFSISVNAPDAAVCLTWRRIAPIGWGLMHATLLHFILILTHKDHLLKKRWFYILLYLPAAITLYVFSISNTLAPQQYHFVHTPYGWTNIAPPNVWDWFFYIYYSSYILGGLVLIWRWGRNSRSGIEKKQAKLITHSFLLALVIASGIDILINNLLPFDIPQITPIILTMPIIIVYYAIIRYGLMRSGNIKEDVRILSESARNSIYLYVSITFTAGSVLSYITLAAYLHSLLKPLSYSAVIFAFALLVYGIRRLRTGEFAKDILLIVTISFAIPITSLLFLPFGATTTWPFACFFIIMSLLFTKRIVLAAISVSIVFTQILVWILRPEVPVIIDSSDYIGRIGILCIVISLAFYVNKVYIQKLRENANQIILQKFTVEISSEFVTVSQLNIDEKISMALEKTGRMFQADHAVVLQFDPGREIIKLTHQWYQERANRPEIPYREISMSAIPWSLQPILQKQVLQITDTRTQLPEDAKAERRIAEILGIRSILSIPIVGRDRVLGFLSLYWVHAIKEWNDEIISIPKVIANIFADALTKVEAEREINFMAYYDHLTRLPNRSLLKDRVNQSIYLAGRTEKLVGLIFLDIDGFKTVNDTLGHEGGDELLEIVAGKLAGGVRKSDSVSRFGGDEFIIMVNHISHRENIRRIADNIMSLFKDPFIIRGQEFFITISAGIAVYPLDGQDTEALIKNADIAMYKAKESGKNRYVFCSPEMKEEIHTTMKLINSLYRALERQELFIHYQPQVELQTKQIIGVEALLRWKHPELGIVSPDVFIPLAEQTGLIQPIGEWVLRTACRQNRQWQDRGYPKVCMAVNLSVYQFRNPRLVEQVSGILRETGLEPRYLELEITESIAVNEEKVIKEVLGSLKKLGLTIAIDDFGTAYSSLNRLKLMPIDRLKMDILFVRGIEGDEKDRAIAKVIINLARNLGLKVIAEGVETRQQVEFLAQELCDEAQGYYFYRPMPAEEMEKLFLI